jgi:hypothetical protein
MTIEYYMVRIFTPVFYTLEFFLVLIVFIIVIILRVKNIEKQSIKVFIVAGIINTLVELLLQGIGTRLVENAYFFTMPIGFPFTCLIMGFFDGGLKNLFAYYTVKSIKNRKKKSKSLAFTLFFMVFIVFSIYNSITATLNSQGNSNVTLTQRSLFSLSSIVLLIVSFIGSFSYFFLKKSIPREDRNIFLYYAFGLIVFLCSWTITAQIFMTRYIGIGGILPASILEQILLMWGYFLLFEGVGVSIFIAPIIYQLKIFGME